jgi:ribosomal protein S18 acetylase RimI-like enzyme
MPFYSQAVRNINVVNLLIYQLKEISNVLPQKNIEMEHYEFVMWRPTLSRFTPPAKGKKYFLYWLFHFLRIFANKDYCCVQVFHDGSLVSSLLVVPRYFKWPFMEKNDLQFTYVMTHRDHRGKGIAEKAIRYAIEKLNSRDRKFWYVTDISNNPSITLCNKVGFNFFSYGEKKGFLKNIKPLGSHL